MLLSVYIKPAEMQRRAAVEIRSTLSQRLIHKVHSLPKAPLTERSWPAGRRLSWSASVVVNIRERGSSHNALALHSSLLASCILTRPTELGTDDLAEEGVKGSEAPETEGWLRFQLASKGGELPGQGAEQIICRFWSLDYVQIRTITDILQDLK